MMPLLPDHSSDPAQKAKHAASFGAAAELYERARPGYPDDAVAWLVGPVARDVVDVGAGTGKLTRQLMAPGRRVTAVDHDAGMIAELSRRVPEVEALVGRAEALPLADASADALVFGQAWHWVDVAEASREAGRVLRPGGVLGLVWNLRDDSVPWVAEFGEVMRGSDAAGMFAKGGPAVAAPFGAIEERVFSWSTTHTPESLVELAASRSYLLTARDDERAAVLAGVRRLGERVAGPDGTIELPYVTHAFRAIRP
ncbi:class I SAM-dependent methyltransferase [Microbacterium paludicola]|uniref:class I SAM-dependent methyltransferase n=1 Tax=Microbacterium paludicola TaxID=300019 RepID=UPI00387A5168